MEITPIGVIHTPFKKKDGMPVQPAGGTGVQGSIEIFEEFQSGLKDLDGFSHITLIFEFHRSNSYKLEVIPFMDTQYRGLFSTRAPRRPNPIGLSTVQLNKIENGILYIQNLDILDGTPLLDIKPYVPEFDEQTNIRTGWLMDARKAVLSHKSDERFE